jgi:hypothetical protein
MVARPLLRRDAFVMARELGLAWPDVEACTKYDGSPLLKAGGCFMAGLAMHASAEPDTLVVRIDPTTRPDLLDDAPQTYYLTDYYEPHPVVLVRAARIDREALRDLLAMARRTTLRKADRRRGPRPLDERP